MTLKFSRKAKVTVVVTGRRPKRPAANNDFKFSRNAKVVHALTGRRPVRFAADNDFEI